MQRLCNLPNGCSLYVKENEAGGRTYYSDEVGGGVFVWDTALIDISTLLAAITEENVISKMEEQTGSFNIEKYKAFRND